LITHYTRPNRRDQIVSCGGIVSSSRFVMTAAHCFNEDVQVEAQNGGEVDFDRDRAHIYLGTLEGQEEQDGDCQQEIVVRADDDFIQHERYNEDYRNKDIGLIRTPVRINIDNVLIARAVLGNWRSWSRPGWHCEISGWGATTETLNPYWNLPTG